MSPLMTVFAAGALGGIASGLVIALPDATLPAMRDLATAAAKPGPPAAKAS